MVVPDIGLDRRSPLGPSAESLAVLSIEGVGQLVFSEPIESATTRRVLTATVRAPWFFLAFGVRKRVRLSEPAAKGNQFVSRPPACVAHN